MKTVDLESSSVSIVTSAVHKNVKVLKASLNRSLSKLERNQPTLVVTNSIQNEALRTINTKVIETYSDDHVTDEEKKSFSQKLLRRGLFPPNLQKKYKGV